MTIDELLAREAIRATMARYTVAGDRLRADDFVATFTDDGVLESDGVPARDAFRYVGRDALRGWITRWHAQTPAAAGTRRATFVRHHLATCQIELGDADNARSRTYWTAYTDIGPDHCGHYLDAWRRHEGQWLIAHRKVRLDWRSPDSLFVDAIERAAG